MSPSPPLRQDHASHNEGAERGDRRQGHAEARPPRSAAAVSAAAVRAGATPDLAQVVAGQLGAFAVAQALADLKRSLSWEMASSLSPKQSAKLPS